jgi:anti-anti-sigma factor
MENSDHTPIKNSAAVMDIHDRILIVDDDKLVLKALEMTLINEGYEVLSATNGHDALQMLQEHAISIVICDQRMPEMKGVELLSRAKIIKPETLRILLTGNGDLQTAKEAINIGQVNQFLEKPWDNELLISIVRELMEKYQLVKENHRLQNQIGENHKELASTHKLLRDELELAARIHETLLLGYIPRNMTEFSIDATTIPSKQVDGDFFDFYRPSSQVLDIVSGDVMGKGISAALVGTAVKTQLLRFAVPFSQVQSFTRERLWQDDLLSPQEIIQNVHNVICKQLIDLEYFVSLFYGRFHLQKKTFTYVDCGSVKPLHFRKKTNDAISLSGSNLALGVIAKETYLPYQTTFEKGDVFVFCSDGVTESRSPNKEIYGFDRLISIIEKNAHLEVQEILTIIKESVIQFAKKIHFDDDLTIIVIKILSDEIAPNSTEKEAKFSSDLSQLSALRDFIKKICINAKGNSGRLLEQLQLAINEAFCNIVKHSYKGKPGQIIIVNGELQKEGILIEISDQGPPFNPSQIPEPSLAGDKDDGFGWFIIKAIADHISYVGKKSETGWNHLRIFKRYFFGENLMEVEHTITENILIIIPKGETLDAKEASTFKEKVTNLISVNNTNLVIFDLHCLQFIDSSGLGSFLSVLRTLNSHGGELKLARMNKPVRTMFELVFMHKIFEIFNSTEEAIKSFKFNKNSYAQK